MSQPNGLAMIFRFLLHRQISTIRHPSPRTDSFIVPAKGFKASGSIGASSCSGALMQSAKTARTRSFTSATRLDCNCTLLTVAGLSETTMPALRVLIASVLADVIGLQAGARYRTFPSL
jgi:hypothetical protein